MAAVRRFRHPVMFSTPRHIRHWTRLLHVQSKFIANFHLFSTPYQLGPRTWVVAAFSQHHVFRTFSPPHQFRPWAQNQRRAALCGVCVCVCLERRRRHISQHGGPATTGLRCRAQFISKLITFLLTPRQLGPRTWSDETMGLEESGTLPTEQRLGRGPEFSGSNSCSIDQPGPGPGPKQTRTASRFGLVPL